MVKEAAPPDPVEEAWREAGQWLAQGRSRDARDRLAQVLKLAPRHDAARQTLITLLIEAGERGEAQRLLAEGRDLHPQEPWYPRALAQLHLQNGRPAQAAASLQSALNASSRAEDWALYAGVAAKLGRHDEAASAWRSALRGQPDQGVWWIGLGVALERLGQRPDALQAYQRAALTQLSPELREFVQGKLAE
jgi:MSHA biogenesis protein MshN